MASLREVYRERANLAWQNLREMFSPKQPAVRFGLFGLGGGMTAAGLWAVGSSVALLEGRDGFLEYVSLRSVMLGIDPAFGAGLVGGIIAATISDASRRTAATTSRMSTAPMLVACFFYVLGLLGLCGLQAVTYRPPLWIVHFVMFNANMLALGSAVAASFIINLPPRPAK